MQIALTITGKDNVMPCMAYEPCMTDDLTNAMPESHAAGTGTNRARVAAP